jgi:hypothetical protein
MRWYMEILLLVLGLLSVIVLLITSVRKYMGFKVVLLLLLMIFAGGVIFYNSMDKNDEGGTDIISSFLSGNSTPASKGSILIPSTEEEPAAEWKTLNTDMADVWHESDSFTLRPNTECIWWKKGKGPMVFKEARGDFYFSSGIRTRKKSDTLKFPDDAWQLAGIIIRSPADESKENYVFISVGFRESYLQIEVKNTVDNETTSHNYEWPSGDAELMIQRESGVFGMHVRPYGTKAAWKRIQTIYRPDMPRNLQAGITAYSYSYGRNIHDFIAYFDDITIRKANE